MWSRLALPNQRLSEQNLLKSFDAILVDKEEQDWVYNFTRSPTVRCLLSLGYY